MADNKPAPQDRKTSYIAPLVIAAVVAGIFAVSILRQPAPPPPAPVKAAAPKAVEPALPAVTAPLPPLTRNDMLDGVNQATRVYAATGKDAPGKDALVGQRFSLRIPFGCSGILGTAGTAQSTLSFDAMHQSITLSARPGNWTTLPVIQDLPGAADIETVEGFWVPRPWSASESCPPKLVYPVPVTPTPPTAQTLGLAQIFAADASRVGQHADHAYDVTRKIPQNDTAMIAHSYRLVLEGRITGFSDGRAVHCSAESPNHQPVCLYAVAFDHVAFEDADTGDVLANWNNEHVDK